jgi:hypothetical protein
LSSHVKTLEPDGRDSLFTTALTALGGVATSIEFLGQPAPRLGTWLC